MKGVWSVQSPAPAVHKSFLLGNRPNVQGCGLKTENCFLDLKELGLRLEVYCLGLGLTPLFLAVYSRPWCIASHFSFQLEILSLQVNSRNDHALLTI